jgi:NCS1 family nucleobase:cation symporter-1
MAEVTDVARGVGGSLELDAPPTHEGYEAFKLEKRGIELIPESERPMRPSGLFWMWAGAIWNIEFVVYGALIVSFGLSFNQAILAILVGNLVYAFLGWASLPGPDTGTTTFMASRAPFGRNGNRAPSLFNWMTQVGFEIEGMVLVVLIVKAMFNHQGIGVDAGWKAVILVLAVGVQFILPFLGHATIIKTLRVLSFVFIVVFAVMAAVVIPNVHLASLKGQHVSWWIWTTALVLIVSAGGLGWTENAADYSRYLPKDTPRARTFWAATLGGAVPSIILEVLGATAYVVSPNASAATGVPAAFGAASWFFWPFLILALPQIFCINTIDMYSSGVTLQAIGIPVKRWGCVVIDTIICGGVAALVLYKGNFYDDLAGFLNYIVVWLAPWFAVFIVDYWLRRGRYDVNALAAKRGGVYWRNGGVNWRAIIALFAGMFAAMMWVDAAFYFPKFTSYISTHTNGADFSWALGLIVAGVLYFVLSFSSVRKETEAMPRTSELRTAAASASTV